jgi:hypothetical protein
MRTVEPHAVTILACDNPEASCLISCSHWMPDGSLSVFVRRHDAMNVHGHGGLIAVGNSPDKHDMSQNGTGPC